MMSRSPICQHALADLELLRQVVEFKRKFYPRAWARYDLAYPGEIRLMPPNHSLTHLAEDYERMKTMIYGEYPPWNEILKGLERLENAINARQA